MRKLFWVVEDLVFEGEEVGGLSVVGAVSILLNLHFRDLIPPIRDFFLPFFPLIDFPFAIRLLSQLFVKILFYEASLLAAEIVGKFVEFELLEEVWGYWGIVLLPMKKLPRVLWRNSKACSRVRLPSFMM